MVLWFVEYRQFHMLIMAVLESAIFWIVVAALSEIIALSPLKDNSVIQLVLRALGALKNDVKKD